MREKQLFWSLYGNASARIRPRVDALWFDSNSIRYSIPVNSPHPSIDASVSGMFGSRVADIENLRFNLYSNLSYDRSISYQADGLKEALNTASFDYNAFMSEFWGTDGSNYVSDNYHNAIGRYILLGASLRFGKMNPDRASAAQSSMWKMM